MKLNVQGKNGLSLSDLWSEKGPETYLGLQIADFPNLFTVTGPGSPSVLSNMICSIEQHVNFIATLIGTMESNHVKSIECTQEAQREWSKAVTARAAPTMLMSPSCKSWYLGSNVEGRKFLSMIISPKFIIYIIILLI
jgi:cation diffusion facilitator CzcD-associated flavoprotein CzcO